MTNTAASVPTPRFGIGRFDRIRIGDIAYRSATSTRDSVTLVRCDGSGLHEVFSHGQLYQLLDADRLHIDPSYFSPAAGRLRQLHGDLKLTDLDPDTQKLVNWKADFVERFLKLERIDRRVTRSDPSLKRVIERIGRELDAERTLGSPKRRPGMHAEMLVRPSPTQFRRWLKLFEDGGFERISLVPAYPRSGNRTPRIEPEVRAIMNTIVPTYASNLRPSGRKIHADLAAAIDALNSTRPPHLPPLKTPSLKTVYRAIAKLDAFHVLAGRKGKEYARKKFFVVHEGVDVTRLLERVEMDTWEVQLITLLVDMGLADKLSDEQRKAAQRVRCSLTAAIDCASRYILALDLRAGPPSSAGAIAALQMITADKTPLSSACGAQTPWHGRGSPELIVTDRGAEFVHDHFRSTVADLGSTHVMPPAGLPQMRGTIERLFRTIDGTLLSCLSGRTYSNPQDRGDYNATEQASLTVDELRKILYRWVEIYHNTPHEGLGGETPEDAWARLAKECEVKPAPAPSEARHIFGLRTQRRIGNRGIQFLGLRYQSEELQQYRREVNQRPVTIRVDPQNLGAISFRMGPSWKPVPCVQDFAHGLTASDWIAATRRLRERHASLAAIRRPVVIAAINDIREMSAAAMNRSGLPSPVLTEDELRALEHDLYRTFRIREGKATAICGADAPDVLDDVIPDSVADELHQTEHQHANATLAPSPYGDADEWSVED